MAKSSQRALPPMDVTKVTSSTVADHDPETEGEQVPSTRQEDVKAVAVKCWREIVDHSGVDDKVLAIDIGMTPKYYSKIAAGEQGCLLNLIYLVGRKRPELRREFIARLAEREDVDLLTQATEQLATAAIRFLRLRGIVVPARALMAKADLKRA